MTTPDAQPPIVDAHSDLLLELVHAEHEAGDANPFAARWLPLLQRGGVALQVCAIYVEPHLPPGDRVRELLRQARSFRTAIDADPDRAFAVEAAADLVRVGDAGRTGLLLSLEGAAALEGDPWLIDVLARLGVRMVALTWNERNAFAGGCDHDEGLTRAGERLVDRMGELGIVLDLAHASPRTMADALDRAGDTPVVVSHAGCRSVYEHRRNLSDAQLRSLARNGGVLGLMPHPYVVDPATPTIDRFLEHVNHAVEVMGIGHVGLGGDFLHQIARALGLQDEIMDGVRAGATLAGLDGPQDYPRLAAALRDDGWDDEAVAALLGGNLLRVLGRGLPQP